MRLLLLPGMLAFAVAFSPPLAAQGDGSFQAPQAVLLSLADPVGGAAGDFNGDGKLDLAEVNLNHVGIVLQDAQSREVWKPLPLIPIGTSNFFMLAADFSGDGADDLVVVDTAAAVYVLRSNRDGTFEKLPVAGTRGCRWLATGDWNGDGVLDLAVAGWNSGMLLLFQGKGDGTFSPGQGYSVGGRPHAVAALDWDGDGRKDLVAGMDRPGLRPLRNAGGTFEAKAPLLLTFEACYRSLYEGEFNGDGRADLMMSCGIGLSQGDGNFLRTLDISEEVAAVGDANGDRFEDVLVQNYLYLGRGDGTFEPSAGPRTKSPYFVVRDLDGDRVTDIALRTGAATTASIYWGEQATALDSGTPTCVGAARDMAVIDLDRDGALDMLRPSRNAPEIMVIRDFRREDLGSRMSTIAVSKPYSTLEAADLNEDGLADLAGTQLAGSLALVAILETPEKVRSEQAISVGAAPARTVLARVDEDASLDMVIPCTALGHPAVCLNQGAGHFAEALLVPTIAAVRDAALADLDGDGRTDAAVMSTAEVGLHFGEGAGRLSGHATLRRDPSKLYEDVAIADMNADGLPDIAVAEKNLSEVHIFHAKGARAFADPLTIGTAGQPAVLLAADFDGDGRMDFAAGNGSQVAEVFLSRAGAYEARKYAIGFVPTKLRSGDFNGDGALDLLAHSESCATVLLGRPAGGKRFTRGDADGDGRMEVNDPVAVLGSLFLGQGPLPCEDAADANDDGTLDLTDPVAVLQRLFLGGAPLPPPEACGEDPTADGLPDCSAGC